MSNLALFGQKQPERQITIPERLEYALDNMDASADFGREVMALVSNLHLQAVHKVVTTTAIAQAMKQTGQETRSPIEQATLDALTRQYLGEMLGITNQASGQLARQHARATFYHDDWR